MEAQRYSKVFLMTSLREIELRPGEEAAEGARQKEEVGIKDVKLRHVPRRDDI